MKIRITLHPQSVLLATITAIIIFGAFGSTFAQDVGAKYRSRDPRVCKDKKQPRTGAITAAQAKEYLTVTQRKFSALISVLSKT